MQSRRFPAFVSSRPGRAVQRSRQGEANSQTVVIIILAVVGGIMLLGCVGVMILAWFGYRQGAVGGRLAAQRVQSSNNLKQIGLGLHNYHDTYRQFPPGGIYGEDDTAFHSWQTMILPFVEQAPLHDQIDFDRPWDDPVNSGLFTTPIQTYQHPAITALPFDESGFAVSHYAGNSRLFLPNGTTRLRDITDGTSNTIMAGEVSAGFKPWGDPSNLRDPALGIGPGAFSGPAARTGTRFLLVDGSVKSISSDISPDTMEALATPRGGEQIGEF
jgi:hypothetical protein